MAPKVFGGVPWLRVFAEFLAIFAGVSLSLAADDWRQHRDDVARERTLLEGLRADLDADSADMQAVLNGATAYDRGAAWLRFRLDAGPPIPPDSMRARFGAVTFSSSYQPVTTTYVALREGGQMTLIRSVQLRRMITQYYEVDQESASFLYGYVRDQNYRWREAFRPYWDVPLADTLSSHSPIQFRLIRPWARLAADEDLRSKLVELGISGGVAAGSFQSLIAKNRDLANAIDAELGRD